MPFKALCFLYVSKSLRFCFKLKFDPFTFECGMVKEVWFVVLCKGFRRRCLRCRRNLSEKISFLKIEMSILWEFARELLIVQLFTCKLLNLNSYSCMAFVVSFTAVFACFTCLAGKLSTFKSS